VFTSGKKLVPQTNAKVLLFLVFFILIGCQSQPNLKKEKYREAQALMGTTISVDVCKDKNNEQKIEAAYKEVWQKLEDIAWRMNVFDERSDVVNLNRSAGEMIQIPSDTYEILERSVYFHHLTQGAFDITVYPLIQLWKESARQNKWPDAEELRQVKESVGSNYIEFFPSHKVRLNHPALKIDLGGIAAGFAIDEAAQIFRRQGIVNFYIDIGGDIYAGGHNCQNKPWRIGIANPQDRSKLMEIVELTDAAIATSGYYEKYTTIQNERLSHIMNPMTGFPQKEIISATIITPTAIEADALSTALCVLGAEEGITLVNSLGNGYASLIMVQGVNKNMKRYASEEYQKYLTQP